MVYVENNLYTCYNDTQDKIRELIEELQPGAVIIQRTSQGGDVRWTGNEEGYAEYPLWNAAKNRTARVYLYEP